MLPRPQLDINFLCTPLSFFAPAKETFYPIHKSPSPTLEIVMLNSNFFLLSLVVITTFTQAIYVDDGYFDPAVVRPEHLTSNRFDSMTPASFRGTTVSNEESFRRRLEDYDTDGEDGNVVQKENCGSETDLDENGELFNPPKPPCCMSCFRLDKCDVLNNMLLEGACVLWGVCVWGGGGSVNCFH